MAEKHQHLFDNAIQLAGELDNYRGHTSPAYANMVGPFGGITATVMLKALLDHPKRQGDPITITVNFAAPIKDGAFEIVTNLIRTNRSTQHWVVTLLQDNGVSASGTAVLATRRETWGASIYRFPLFQPMLSCCRMRCCHLGRKIMNFVCQEGWLHCFRPIRQPPKPYKQFVTHRPDRSIFFP